MKRLFKSKPGVDPLPPPSPPPQAPQPPQPQHQPKRSLGGVLGPPQEYHGHHDNRPRHGVTPFPVDLGREANGHAPKPPKGKDKPLPVSHTAPSLLEIQQMQAQAPVPEERDSRRDQWLATQRMPPPPRPTSNAEAPDGWTLVSGSPTTLTQPFYLPPGARPPSPQIPRAATPTRHAPSSSSHGQHGVEPMEYAPPRTRDRGYSSASGSLRGSDHEGSVHGHPIPVRSPLANTYHSPEMPSSTFPQPHPFSPPPGPPGSSPGHTNLASLPPPPNQMPMLPPKQAQNQPDPMYDLNDQMGAVRVEGPTPEEGQKEKKKFWGMSKPWERERKDRSRPLTPEDGSRFVENLTEESFQGHEDRSHRVMGMDLGVFRGRDSGRDNGRDHPQGPENVTAAIQMLCAHPDPPFSTSFEICERINHSAQSDSVSKEAAHALRKQFKHGNEAERRAATSLWLIMMQNIPQGFRAYATSKKFLVPLETILTAPLNKPLVSISTRKMMTDVIADLTYNFGHEKGSEALVELWKKVKMPQESEYGVPLPTDHQAFAPETFYDTRQPSPRPRSTHLDGSVPPPVPIRGSHLRGPEYAHLPDHGDDMRRLLEECVAAKESARVLAEALVFTRPEELDEKPLIHEFYRKCFLAHESLTHQIEWAQAEAAQSRERVLIQARMEGSDDEARGSTLEEEALHTLFEAHSALGEALKQHDDLERMARDEMEMREVRERSKKETRMNRTSMMDDMLKPAPAASGSRSPSPAPHSRLPAPDHISMPMPHPSPRQDSAPLPIPPVRTFETRSRTPSPDRIPKLSSSPGRASPLGMGKTRRPLPNPFRTEASGPLGSSLPGSVHEAPRSIQESNPSRSGTGSTHDGSGAHEAQEGELAQPSRKALGKRRAQPIDPDNHFDPDDMFGISTKKSTSSSSSESLVPEEAPRRPVVYAYDAYKEKVDAEVMSREGSSQNHGSAGAAGIPGVAGSGGLGGSGGSGGGGGGSGAGRTRQGSLASLSSRRSHRRTGSGELRLSPRVNG